jgi:small-conductance mechanosensitive channel
LAIRKAKQRISDNSLQNDVYTERMGKFVWKFIFIGLTVFNVLIALQVAWFEVALLMWGVSLSIGFALQDVIGNTVAGMLMFTHKKFKLGDKILLLWDFNIVWVIEEVHVRYAIIRLARENRRLLIPSMKLSATPIKTFNDNPTMKWELSIKVGRHVDIGQIKQLLLQTIKTSEDLINKEENSVIVSWFDAHGIEMRLFYFFSPLIKKWPFQISSELRILIKQIFVRYGIHASYKHITLNTE